MTRAEKVIENFHNLIDTVWEYIQNDIAIDVSVYVRDKSNKCRIDDVTCDWEIRTRRIAKWLMHYDNATIKSMNDTWYNTQEGDYV